MVMPIQNRVPFKIDSTVLRLLSNKVPLCW